MNGALQTACAAWRAREEKEVAAIVITDRDLQRVLVAWPTVPREVLPAALSPDSEWRTLWEAVRVDEHALVEMTGLQSGRAQVAYRRAVALRLIYPDGAVHQWARMVLQKILKDALTGPRK